MTLTISSDLRAKKNWLHLEQVRRAIWIALFVCMAAGFVCVRFQAPSFVPLLGRDDWISVTGFFENSWPSERDIDRSILGNSEARFYRSLKPDGSPANGGLQSRPFRAPQVLVVPFTGYPIEAGVHLALRCVDSTREMPIATGNAHEYWVQRLIEIPPSFCAGPVQ